MKLSRTFASVVAVLALAAPALAQGDAPADLAGTWKRDDGKLYRLDLEPGTGELVGKMLEPPAVDEGSPVHYSVEIHLKVQGKSVTGRAIWTEPNPDNNKAGQPPAWAADAVWKLELAAPGKLEGETEWLDWGHGKIVDRGFDKHSFERLPQVTLGGPGAGPDKVSPGAAIDEKAIAGTWRSSRGALLLVKAKDGAFVMEKRVGPRSFPAEVKLVNDGNLVRGSAVWLDGPETKLELALVAPGRLEGRAERLDGADRSWAPFALDRLPRIDGDGMAFDNALAAGAAGAAIGLDLKRDDGLYLRLTKKDGAYEGDLVAKGAAEATPRAHVRLAPGTDNKLVGSATFTVDGAPIEARWELAPGTDGSIDARCEWLDWDPATKTIVSRGFTARKFKTLRRVG